MLDKFRLNLAVVIGIDDYQNGVPSLKTPVNDAQTLAAILVDKHGYEVELILNHAADRAALLDLLETKLPQRLGQNDRLLFYFAGHGIALNGDDGPEGYLIPADASLGAVSTYLPMAQVNQALLKLPCRHFLGILDCCFAGAFRWSNTRKLVPIDLGTIHQERFDRFIQDPAWQVITSAASDQFALDAFDLKSTLRGLQGNHSPFAAALIEALEGQADAYPPADKNKPAGDGVITATELYLYLRDRIEPDTIDRAIRQTPGIFPLTKHDKGEYIFLSPGHPLNLPPAPPLDVSSNPYRGLEAFNEDHKDLFFGRQVLTQALTECVLDQSLTVVLGSSGSGKSSLVKAGLIPKLRQKEDWRLLPTLRPGESPFKALNQALELFNLSVIGLTAAQTLADWFEAHPQANLLVVVDQFEELITLCRDELERQQFFDLLAGAIVRYPNQLHLVLTLRSDFEPQFRNTALEIHWQAARFVLPAMARDELRQAIEAPASARVMYFDPHELVDRLIDEVANMPGALPLLSFALSELYLNYLQRQEAAKNRGETLDRAITNADYEEMGGVIQSLTQRADLEYEALVEQDSAHAEIIRHLLLRMIAIGGGELARRRVPLSELEYPPDKSRLVNAVINHFTVLRLLVNAKDTENNPYVEPAHDALVRGWPRLLNWVKEEKNLRLQRRLTSAALEWQNNQQQRFLWDDDPYLDVLNQEVLKSPNNNWLNQIETEFTLRSIKQRRKNSMTRWSLVSIVFLALGSITWAAINSAINAENKVLETSSALTESNLASKHELEALTEGIKAGERLKNLLPFVLREDTKMRVVLALRKMIYEVREHNRLESHNDEVKSISFSPDGEVIASANSDNTINLWQRDGKLIQTLKEHKSSVSNIIFSPDGRTLVSSSSDDTIKLWKVQPNKKIKLSKSIQDPEGITAISLSPDNKTIATATNLKGNHSIKIWHYDGKLISTLPGHNDQVRDLSFSPDGLTIASAGLDKKIKFWDVKKRKFISNISGTGKFFAVRFMDNQSIAVSSTDEAVQLWTVKGEKIHDLTGYRNDMPYLDMSRDRKFIASGSINNRIVNIWSIKDRKIIQTINTSRSINKTSFSPDGNVIALASSDGSVYLWSRKGMALPNKLQGKSFSFSPESQIVVLGTDDGNIELWQRDEPQWKMLKSFKGSDQGILKVGFSPNGRIITSISKDKVLRIWNLNGDLIDQLKEDKNSILAISFSPDGKLITSAHSDATVRLWDFDEKNIRFRKTFTGHKKEVTSVSFSPDKQEIVSASSDSTVKLWGLDGTLRKSFLGHTDAVLDVNFSPNGKKLVTASIDNTIRIWDVNNPLHSIVITDAKSSFLSAKFSPSSNTIISGSGDGKIRLWNLDGSILQTLSEDREFISNVNFSNDGKTIGSVGFDQKVILWNFDLDDLLRRGCIWQHDYLKNNLNSEQSKICQGK
jgi:WD40 repeat protein